MRTYINTWKKFTEFTTRSSRADYWLFYGLNYVLILGLLVASTLAYSEGADSNTISVVLTIIALFINVASILPALALTIRRLHDAGVSGWYAVLGFLPIVGFITVIVFGILPSKPEENEYGPAPTK